jgi:WD40 repeat protein
MESRSGMNDKNHSPYVGPRTFKTEESDLFFGREREALDLLSLVISERLVLFYAQSGAGKSSLINTKLIPGLLAEEEYQILPIGRVGGAETASSADVENIYIYNLIHSLLSHDTLRDSHTGLTLMNVLRDFKTGESNRLKQVLIIDQFEELFSAHQDVWEQRKDFFVQLAQAMQADRSLWVVLVMREDYIAYMDPYIHLLHNGLRVRYYMQRLEREAALKAITEPVRSLRPYAEGVAEKLVDDLRSVMSRGPDGKPIVQPGQYVEPVQLQVVCSSLWEKLPADVSQITQEHIDKYVGDVNQALGIYYEERVSNAAEGALAREKGIKERQIREWFGKQLITTGGIRNMVAQEYGGKSGGLDDDIVQEFVKKGDLVRAERRGGATFYELTHDRLVEPILVNNKKWEAEHTSVLQQQARFWEQRGRSEGLLLRGKELLKAEREASVISLTKEEQEFLDACRKLRQQEVNVRRRNSILAILTVISIIAMGAAVVFGLSALKSDQKANEQLQNSESLRLALQASTMLTGAHANPEQATLLSIRALRTMYVSQADGALVKAMSQLDAIRNFGGHSDYVNGAAFSPDGRYVLTGSGDHTAKLWDATTGKAIRTFNGHSGPINSVAFSADGKYVLTAGWDKLAKLWDVTTGKEILTFRGHSDGIHSIAFSRDGKYILTGSSDRTAKLWDVTTGKEIRTFRGHSNTVYDVAFSPDGKYVLTGSADQTAKLWDANTGKEIRTFRGHSEFINSVAFSPAGRYVLTGSGDQTAKLWDANTGKEIRTFRGHSNTVFDVAFSPDGKYVLTGSADQTAKLWDANTGKEIRTFRGHSDCVSSVAFAPDGKSVLTASWDTSARLWETSGILVNRIFTGHSDQVYAVAFSPDGKYVLTGSADQTAKLWDANTGKEIRTFSGHLDSVFAVAFSPDGKYVLTGSADQTAKLWDANTGKQIRTFRGHSNFITSVAFSPDGKYALTGSTDETAKLWNVTTGKESRTFSGHSDSIQSVAFSPDGRYVLTGSADRTAKLWDANTGKEIRTFSGHSDTVHAVAFSPDGKSVLTGSIDYTAKLWKTETAMEIRTFKGHRDRVFAVAFSPDGKYVLTGSADQTAKLWDANTDKEAIRTFSGHSDSVFAVAFSPDGLYIVTGSYDKTARVWDVDYHKTVELACSVISRDLTSSERAEFGISDNDSTCPQ